MVGADRDSLSGGIVLTPVSAPRLRASLQPSASAESKSRGEQLVVIFTSLLVLDALC